MASGKEGSEPGVFTALQGPCIDLCVKGGKMSPYISPPTIFHLEPDGNDSKCFLMRQIHYKETNINLFGESGAYFG